MSQQLEKITITEIFPPEEVNVKVMPPFVLGFSSLLSGDQLQE